MISIKSLKKPESETPNTFKVAIIDEEELEYASQQEKGTSTRRTTTTKPSPAPMQKEAFSSKLERQIVGQKTAKTALAENDNEDEIEEDEVENVEEEDTDDGFEAGSPTQKDGKKGSVYEPNPLKLGANTLAGQTIEYKPRLKMYRKFAFIFFFLVVLLSGVVFYLSYVKMTVVITPAQETISNNLIFDVMNTWEDPNQTPPAGSVAGKVEVFKVEDSMEVQTTGEKVLSEEVGGKVKIINNYSNQQQLVASTRLLSADQKLFRIKNTVLVPSGGSVDVDVYADKPGADMSVGPTRFTIPGLWAGLQDKIYAESSESMKNVRNVKKYVTSDDISKAETEIKAALLKKAEEDIKEKYGSEGEILFKIDDDTIVPKISARIDEEKEKFQVSAMAEANIVVFKREDATKVISDKFINTIPQEKELITFNEAEVKYGLNDFNATTMTASVNATFDGKMALKDGSTAVDAKTLVGLNQAQIEDYLRRQKDIASYDIVFTPSFIKTAPRLVDRIKVEVRK